MTVEVDGLFLREKKKRIKSSQPATFHSPIPRSALAFLTAVIK